MNKDRIIKLAIKGLNLAVPSISIADEDGILSDQQRYTLISMCLTAILDEAGVDSERTLKTLYKNINISEPSQNEIIKNIGDPQDALKAIDEFHFPYEVKHD